MNSNLKVVQYTRPSDPILDIANSIQEGSWSNISEKVDLLQFMKMVGHDEYIIDPDKSLQVRGTTLDFKFVDRQVMKIETTGDLSGLKDPVLIYFAEEVEYEGTVFPADSLAILDRNHGIVIRIRCAITVSNCYVVNYDTDLNSKMSNVRALGNILNLVFEEAQSTTIDNIRTEYHQMMDEKGRKLTEEENAIFLQRYPFINSTSLGNFSGSHSTGGRKKPVKSWSETELITEQVNHQHLYKDWLVMAPRKCGVWKGEPSGQASWDALNNSNDKIVFIFWPATVAQTKKKYQKGIKAHFVRWAERYGLEVKVIFLRSK